jgi:hypothetical protein
MKIQHQDCVNQASKEWSMFPKKLVMNTMNLVRGGVQVSKDANCQSCLQRKVVKKMAIRHM